MLTDALLTRVAHSGATKMPILPTMAECFNGVKLCCFHEHYLRVCVDFVSPLQAALHQPKVGHSKSFRNDRLLLIFHNLHCYGFPGVSFCPLVLRAH
jgi:hypothetical protein